MFVAGLASWGWARFLLNCPVPEDLINLSKTPKADRARYLLRRACGVLPLWGVGFGFLFAADNSGEIPQCLVLAAISFVSGAALWFLFGPLKRLHLTLNRAAGAMRQQTISSKEVLRIWNRTKTDQQALVERYNNFHEILNDSFTKRTILVTWVACFVVFCLLTRWPVGIGEWLGSPAVVLFAVALWISVGSVLIYLADHLRIPLLTIVLLWAALVCGFFNDNHAIRTLSRGDDATLTPELTNALEQWHSDVSKVYPLTDSSRKRPLYLVASAGGGIRAAYWTAIVLGALEDLARANGTSFAAHTFVMSGVSGGALGEMTFAALLVHGPGGGGSFTNSSRRFLDHDFLAADLAKMAYADLFQRFIPYPIESFDRARSLEEAWAAAWRTTFTNDALNESIGELYDHATKSNIILPHLLLNGTCVETGQRIITSDLVVRSRIMAVGREDSSGNFLDVIPAADRLRGAPIRLSTAVHQSARFTYFSPAGRFPDGTHVVDGGYFENSGAASLMDALRQIRWYTGKAGWTDVETRIILIANDPIPLQPKTSPSRFLLELLSPVRALLNTRTGRGTFAVEQAYVSNWAGTNISEFNLYERSEDEPLGKCKRPAALPLGWTLSQCAMDEMDAQLTEPFKSATNLVTLSNIVASLPGMARKP
jgi:hypothetical protein